MNYIKGIISIWLMVISFAVQGQEEVTIGVSGNCDMCKANIETAAGGVIGVIKADWNAEDQALTVEVKEGMFQVDELHKAVSDVGYDTDKMKGDHDAYHNLPQCCQYTRDHSHDEGHVEDHEEDSPSVLVAEYLKGHDHPEGEDYIHGMVYEKLSDDSPEPLIGASVYWQGTNDGTVTDIDGFFELPPAEGSPFLIVSYIGYEPDTIDMTGQQLVAISLLANNVIDDVTITYKKKSTQISFIDPLKVETITQKELFKAACCSLSESFETNPSLDVSFTDAVTGTRKIQMLGLAGPNVQVMRENMPYVRGIASLYGFEYTPGPWISSIQLNSGTGSVVNGPESITGQINVEVKKPENSEKLFVNLYANEAQRLEANVNSAFQVNDHWSTGVLAHASSRKKKLDRNDDGFYDSPIGEQVFVMNRWKYSNTESGIQGQFGVKGTFLDKQSGQPEDVVGAWTAPIKTNRLEGWAKIGKVFPSNPLRSIGLQLSGSTHDQKASFGHRRYDATHQTLYANLIYQTIIGDPDKKLKVGASIIHDDIQEELSEATYDRQETMPGVFAEYNQSFGDKVSMVLGIRADNHNLFGAFITPRFHLRYSPEETTSIRIAAGRGSRTASIFAENIGLFASNRAIVIQGTDNSLPYGLNQEIANNIGGSITKEFTVNSRSMIFSLDYYYTAFEQQIVVDYDQDVQAVNFYNLDGKSFSHSFQAQLDYELVHGVDMRLAYRFNDVELDYATGRRARELVPRHRAFVNIGADLGKGWSWDGTLTWQGSQRLPITASSPAEFRRAERSPDFYLFNSQISKSFDNRVDFYLGGENLFNYRQDNPIVSVDNPSSEFFDSSMVWGPIMGRNVYVGMRYTLL